MVFFFLYKVKKNDKLSKDFYHRISAIILLFAAILSYNIIFNIETISGIGIYNGLFKITSVSYFNFLDNISLNNYYRFSLSSFTKPLIFELIKFICIVNDLFSVNVIAIKFKLILMIKFSIVFFNKFIRLLVPVLVIYCLREFSSQVFCFLASLKLIVWEILISILFILRNNTNYTIISHGLNYLIFYSLIQLILIIPSKLTSLVNYAGNIRVFLSWYSNLRWCFICYFCLLDKNNIFTILIPALILKLLISFFFKYCFIKIKNKLIKRRREKTNL